MADTVDKIINFNVNYKDLIDGIKQINVALAQNKTALQAVEKEYKSGEASADEYLQAQIEFKAQNKALTEQLKLYEKEIQNNIKIQTQNENSLKSLRTQYSKGKEALEAMSKAQREGAEGEKLVASLKSIKSEITQTYQIAWNRMREDQADGVIWLRSKWAEFMGIFEQIGVEVVSTFDIITNAIMLDWDGVWRAIKAP